VPEPVALVSAVEVLRLGEAVLPSLEVPEASAEPDSGGDLDVAGWQLLTRRADTGR